MNVDPPKVTYGGLSNIVRCIATRSTGVYPDTIRIDIAGKPEQVPSRGDLTLEYDGTRIEFKDCRTDMAAVEWNPGANTTSLILYDRRWKWSYGQISGSFNLRENDGRIIKSEDGVYDTEEAPQTIAYRCVVAMGEKQDYEEATYEELPNQLRPTFDMEVDDPRSVLSSLLRMLNCRLVFQLDDRIRIKKIGTGARLPTDNYISATANAVRPVLPPRVIVITDPIRYQDDLELESVAEEWDGELVPVDDVSYKPADGWESMVMVGGVAWRAIEDQATRDLAQRCVYRYYRVKLPHSMTTWSSRLDVGDPQFVVAEITHRRQMVLYPEQVLAVPSDEVNLTEGREFYTPTRALVYGHFFDAHKPITHGQAVGGAKFNVSMLNTRVADCRDWIYQYGWSIDRARQLVVFSEPVFRIQDNPDESTTAGASFFGPANLRLRCSFSLQYLSDRRYHRFEISRDVRGGTNDVEPLYIHRPDIVPRVQINYERFANALSARQQAELKTNFATLSVQGGQILDAALSALNPGIPSSVTYAGLRRIDCDGAIAMVQWIVDINGGVTTTAQRNQDLGSRYSLSGERKYQLESVQWAADWRRKLVNAEVEQRRLERAYYSKTEF